jgi:hypothetical protein
MSHSDSDSHSPNKSENLNENDKFKIIKSRKIYDADYGSVNKAIVIFNESQSEQMKNRLIKIFWDLHNKKCFCERHSRDFPSHPFDVNALKFCKKKTVSEEIEKLFICSCNRRHLARQIVRVLNL